jgi:hypothetical protein
MSDLRSAALQALEAMRRAVPTGEITLVDWMKANHDLEAALAETEPQEIADLRQACQEGWRYADELDQERKRLEEDLRAALAEPGKVPVAWMVYTDGGASAYVTDNPHDLIGAYRALPLYTTPAQGEQQ